MRTMWRAGLAALGLALAPIAAAAGEILFDRDGVTLERLRTATGYACDLTLTPAARTPGLTPKFVLGSDAPGTGGLATRVVWFLDVPEDVASLTAEGGGASFDVEPGYRGLSFDENRPRILDTLLGRGVVRLTGVLEGDAGRVTVDLDGRAFSDAFGLLRRDCDVDLSRVPAELLRSAGGEVWRLSDDGRYEDLAEAAAREAEEAAARAAAEAAAREAEEAAAREAEARAAREAEERAAREAEERAAAEAAERAAREAAEAAARAAAEAAAREAEERAAREAEERAAREAEERAAREAAEAAARAAAEAAAREAEERAAREAAEAAAREAEERAGREAEEAAARESEERAAREAEGAKDGAARAGGPLWGDAARTRPNTPDDAPEETGDLAALDAEAAADRPGAPDRPRRSLFGADDREAGDRKEAVVETDAPVATDAAAETAAEICEILPGPGGEFTVAKRQARGVSDRLTAVLAGRRSEAFSVPAILPDGRRAAVPGEAAPSPDGPTDVEAPEDPPAVAAEGDARPRGLAGLFGASPRGGVADDGAGKPDAAARSAGDALPAVAFDVADSAGMILPYRPVAVDGEARAVVIPGLDRALRRADLPVLRIAVFSTAADLPLSGLDAVLAALPGAGGEYQVALTLFTLQERDAAWLYLPAEGRTLSPEELGADADDSPVVPPDPPPHGLELLDGAAERLAALASPAGDAAPVLFDHVFLVKGPWTVSADTPLIVETMLDRLGALDGYAGRTAPWLTVVAADPGDPTNGYLAIPVALRPDVATMIAEADPEADPRRYIAAPDGAAERLLASFAERPETADATALPKRLLADGEALFETTGVLLSAETLAALSVNAMDWGVRLARAEDGAAAVAAMADSPAAHRLGLIDVLTGGQADALAAGGAPPWLTAPLADMSRREVRGLRADLSRFATLITNAELAAADAGCAHVYIPLNADFSALGSPAK